jgi:hypothetical protein
MLIEYAPLVLNASLSKIPAELSGNFFVYNGGNKPETRNIFSFVFYWTALFAKNGMFVCLTA